VGTRGRVVGFGARFIEQCRSLIVPLFHETSVVQPAIMNFGESVCHSERSGTQLPYSFLLLLDGADS
jgi:hypothetical protein